MLRFLSKVKTSGTAQVFSPQLTVEKLKYSKELWIKESQKVFSNWPPTDTDVLKTSSGHLKKAMTSYDQTKRHVWKKTTDLLRLEDVGFTSSWRRPIYDVLKTSDLRRLEDVWFTST